MFLSSKKLAIILFIWQLKKQTIDATNDSHTPQFLKGEHKFDQLFQEKYIEGILEFFQNYPKELIDHSKLDILKKKLNIHDDISDFVVTRYVTILELFIEIKNYLDLYNGIKQDDKIININSNIEIYNKSKFYKKYIDFENDMQKSKLNSIKDCNKYAKKLIKLIKSFLNHYLAEFLCDEYPETVHTKSEASDFNVSAFYDDILINGIKIYEGIKIHKSEILPDFYTVKLKIVNKILESKMKFFKYCLIQFEFGEDIFKNIQDYVSMLVIREEKINVLKNESKKIFLCNDLKKYLKIGKNHWRATREFDINFLLYSQTENQFQNILNFKEMYEKNINQWSNEKWASKKATEKLNEYLAAYERFIHAKRNFYEEKNGDHKKTLNELKILEKTFKKANDELKDLEQEIKIMKQKAENTKGLLSKAKEEFPAIANKYWAAKTVNMKIKGQYDKANKAFKKANEEFEIAAKQIENTLNQLGEPGKLFENYLKVYKKFIMKLQVKNFEITKKLLNLCMNINDFNLYDFFTDMVTKIDIILQISTKDIVPNFK